MCTQSNWDSFRTSTLALFSHLILKVVVDLLNVENFEEQSFGIGEDTYWLCNLAGSKIIIISYD